VTPAPDGRRRCSWPSVDDALYLAYHDEEWGVPSHDDRDLFEMLILEGAQAGLSWATILRKREGYRRAFQGFDPEVVAAFGEADVERLMGDAGIVRNRAKIQSSIANARAVAGLVEEAGSLNAWIWGFVDGSPIHNRWRAGDAIPAETELSGRLSKELRRRGFRFVGPTVCYSFMQSVGMVNDHLVDCFRYAELGGRP
jgi:DNA-3-methyladenine glycosylase I